MEQGFFKILEEKNINLPDNITSLLKAYKSFSLFNTTDELADAATNGKNNVEFEVKYDIPGKGEYVEAIVQRVKNGISTNYTEAYMRRCDPGTMVIADGKPTDKKRFSDAQTHCPVIACPPVGTSFGGNDIYSSLRMPSGVAPMVVLEPKNAALAAAKILSVSNENIRSKVIEFQDKQRQKLIEDNASLSKE